MWVSNNKFSPDDAMLAGVVGGGATLTFCYFGWLFFIGSILFFAIGVAG